MKRYYAALALMFTLFMTGCLKQDYSDCFDEENVVLKFDLLNSDGTSIFADKIYGIDVMVYDANHHYVAQGRLSKTDLNEFPGIRFTLEPGEYRVVCWGNITNNSNIFGISDAGVFGECYLETVSDATGCPIYYGPEKEITDRDTPIVVRGSGTGIDNADHTLVVQPNKQNTKDILLTQAHRNIKVFVKGYETAVEGAAPTVQMTDMPVRYDFQLRTCPSRKNYSSKAVNVETPSGAMQMTSFNFPISESDFQEDMILNIIRDSDRGIETSVSLKDWVEENKSKISDLLEFSILLIYDELNGMVTITVPDWGNEDVGPGWE